MNILKRPMFIAGLSCTIITAVSLYFKIISMLILAIVLCCLLVLIFRRNLKFIPVLVAVVIFSINLLGEFGTLDTVSSLDKHEVSGRFLVMAEPIEYDNHNNVTLKSIESDTLPENTGCLVFDRSRLDFSTGEIIDATLSISEISIDDEYCLYDYGNGIYTTATILECKRSGEYNELYRTAQKIRTYVKESISAHSDGDSAGLLLAVTTGDRSLLSDEFSNNVKTTGISHVIVVSGMHLSIIMSAVFMLLDRLFCNKYIRSILSILVVFIIAAVCGFTMSIIRAGVMFVVAGLAPVFNRDNDPINSLLTAVTTVMILTPFAIFNISFQLSVLSTLAIIWVAPFYQNMIVERFSISSKIIKTVLNIVLCSVFAMVFTLPITIKAFSYFSVISPVTNLIVTYTITALLVINVLAVSVSAIPYVGIIGGFLFKIADLISQFIVFCVNKLADLPITIAIVPERAFWISMAVIVAVIAYMYFKFFKGKEVIKCQ